MAGRTKTRTTRKTKRPTAKEKEARTRALRQRDFEERVAKAKKALEELEVAPSPEVKISALGIDLSYGWRDTRG